MIQRELHTKKHKLIRIYIHIKISESVFKLFYLYFLTTLKTLQENISIILTVLKPVHIDLL